ncbi:hypothetical protein IV52_GL001253 [Fructilactobacillus lindneri DSM 20690 = JCM 11027]|uniref:DnaB/C C-terminal domain-containing protein n=2 Tax=Fructilactobacillus lindneri TaxID=53444 RepID=A0A0R2JTG8_9LACO|nr:hypothetical protein IV52_GL001253 [Fructilactobacillus lindneri DSM 20690 = JCM 11027]
MPKNEQDNKSLNRLSDYGGGDAEKSLQAVANNFQKNIGVLNAKNIDDLRVWSEDMPLDVINYAIDIAADNNAQTFSYVNSILKRWYQSNIKTIEQAKASSTKNGKRNYGSSNKRKSKRGEIDEELGF